MKSRLLLMILLGAFHFTTFAQICKYEVNEKDPLTDDIIRTIRNRITGPTPYYYFYYIRNGSDFRIRIEVGDYGELTHSIPKDSELIMRVAAGDIIKMNAIEEAPPEIIQDFGQKITRYVVEYQTNEEDMRKVQASGITFIRVSDLKNTFSDQRIPSAVTRISKENADCLFKE